MAQTTPLIWNVRKGQDFRIRAQHPWVFSNELVKSPKGIQPGQKIELHTEHGEFLAIGYGNPHSLIAFRALTFRKEEVSQEWLLNKLSASWAKRVNLALTNSQRICYSENDSLPGLIVDYYTVEQDGKKGQVFAVQVSTYGMEKLIGEDVCEFFKKFHAQTKDLHNIPWSHTAVVLRNDVNQRKHEGLEVLKPKILKPIEFMNLSDIQILITNFRGETVKIFTDLAEGQKTGFFLDQKQNIELVLTQLERMWKAKRPTQFKVLDICSYVGHWSTQVAALAKQMEVPIEIVTADISEKALKFSEKNVQQYTPHVTSLEADVLVDLEKLDDSFDLVICDPPAFIKNKKDLHKGRHAYMKLNSQAIRLTKPGGFMVSCSCSGIFLKEYLQETLVKSAKRANREIQIILDGGHGPDHPHIPSFPEGFYLKMFLCIISNTITQPES